MQCGLGDVTHLIPAFTKQNVFSLCFTGVRHLTCDRQKGTTLRELTSAHVINL